MTLRPFFAADDIGPIRARLLRRALLCSLDFFAGAGADDFYVVDVEI